MKKQIKKIVAILLCVGCIIGVFGCQKKDNSIVLTAENYANYLNISARCQEAGYDGILSSVMVKGVSTNYIYEDVVVEIMVEGTYREKLSSSAWSGFKDFSEIVSATCNVAGDGSATVQTNARGDVVSVDATYAITKIEGRVRPVN